MHGAIVPGTRSCQTRTPSTFFFVPKKRGFVRTLRTHLGYVPGLSFIEFDGEGPWSKVEQAHGQTNSRKLRKVSGDEDTAGVTSLHGAAQQEFEAVELF